MEIVLAQERALRLVPRWELAQAREEVEKRKAALVGGTVTALLSRSKAQDVEISYEEPRLEPCWRVLAHLRTVYDRQATYRLPILGQEVQRLSLAGQTLEVEGQKGSRAVTLSAVEHCQEDLRLERYFDGLGQPSQGLARLADAEREEIGQLDAFRPEGWAVVAPQAAAAAVVRQVLAEAVRPVRAQVIHEERVEVEAIELLFRPLYAFELHWPAKGKRTVAEFDALSGEIAAGTKTLRQQIAGMLTTEVLFDLGTEAASVLVPGGGIAVRLVKAVVDQRSRRA